MHRQQCFGEIKNGAFLRTGAYFVFIFEPLGGFVPPMAYTKALVGVITEIHCSIVGEISTNSSKLHLGSIPVNSAVRRKCGKIRRNALTVPERDGSS